MDIYKELNNILINSENPSIEIEALMSRSEFIESDFNVLNNLKNVPQDKEFHPEGNVWNHTKMIINTAAKIKGFADNDKFLMWAALFHDIGKISTTKFIKGRYRSYNHDKEGKKVTYDILSNYMNKEEVENICEIVGFHMHHIYILKDLPFSNIPKLIKSKNYNDIILLFICDKLGRGNQTIKEYEKTFMEIDEILDKLSNEVGVNNREIIIKYEEIKKVILNNK